MPLQDSRSCRPPAAAEPQQVAYKRECWGRLNRPQTPTAKSCNYMVRREQIMRGSTSIDPIVQSIDRATIAGVVRAAVGAAAELVDWRVEPINWPSISRTRAG